MNQAFWEDKKVLAVLSMFGAALLWLYVVNSEPIIRDFEVPIEYVVPSSHSVANNVKATATVKISGPRMFMNSMDVKKNKLIMLIKSLRYDQTHSVKTDMFNFPFGINIIDFSPKRVRVLLEKKKEKMVFIKPLLVGELSKDVVLSSYSLTPTKVKISGPGSVIRSKKSILTAPIELSELETKGEGEIIVNLDYEDSRVTFEDETQTAFKFFIKPKKANFTLKKIPIRFLSSSRNLRSKIKSVSLDILMPQEKTIRRSEVSVIADIPEGEKGRVKIKLKATLPDDVHLLQINPQYINVTVK